MENIGRLGSSLLETSTSWDLPPLPLIDSSTTLPQSCFIKVPHVRQSYNWDCGLACILMVLKALGFHGCDLNYLHHLCGTTSVWTVDLAHLLRHFSIEVSFLTVTIGANPKFALETFYKENMEEDGKRVTTLFEKAATAGIRIERRSLSGIELSKCILSGSYLTIALVDKRKLSHPWSKDVCMSECCGMNPGYTGHYVVICGFDNETNEFEIRDPAISCEGSRVAFEVLEEARKTFGTDEDLLLISLSGNVKNGNKISSTKISSSILETEIISQQS